VCVGDEKMIKYVCGDTEKVLDELLVIQRALEKEIREVMTEFRNLSECGDEEFGKYSAAIWCIVQDYHKVNELEKNIEKVSGGVVLSFGTFHKLKKYNSNIENVFKGVYREC
jgi:hypothetical protein